MYRYKNPKTESRLIRARYRRGSRRNKANLHYAQWHPLGERQLAGHHACYLFSQDRFVFEKQFLNFKLFYIYLLLEKLFNTKYFSVKEKFNLVFRKMFSCKIWTENIFRKLWKIYKYHIICWLYQIWSSNFWLLYIFCFEY
jgi:hypothetical protein